MQKIKFLTLNEVEFVLRCIPHNEDVVIVTALHSDVKTTEIGKRYQDYQTVKMNAYNRLNEKINLRNKINRAAIKR